MVGIRFPTLIIVDDDARVISSLRQHLEAEGFKVISAGSGREAWGYIEQQPVDLAIVEVQLPDMHGFELCQRIKRFLDLPIIFLSADGSEDSIVTALQHYAEDYVVKPFRPRELSARIHRALKRTQWMAQGGPIAIGPGFQVDFGHHRAIIEGREVHLTPIETRLLAALARNPHRTVRRESLIEDVWAEGEGDANCLWVAIGRLRAKVEDDPRRPRRIVTERGSGYRLNPSS